MRDRFVGMIRAALAVALAMALMAGAAAEGLDQMATLPPVSVLMPAEAVTPAPTLAPIPDAEIEDDGMLRVALRSLDGPQQLHLTLAGVYAVEGDPGFRFDRDARLTLSAVGGSVYMAVGGLTIDMGQSMTLTRHRAGDGAENGAYIDESEKETLYCGDLNVIAEGDTLLVVLNIFVEDYLYGVVGYEMSDSFPIEALKAQAVAARTYAMQRKWQSGGRSYDVVDTTADQVFKGYDADYRNVVKAVDDTRGVVGLYDGAFAICYYTASNGGQTALPSQIWGRADGDAYLTMRDDPYDLENPRSLQNTLTVNALCEGSEALREMLEAALGEKMAKKGYVAGEWAFDSIASVAPVNPRFEGSRLYDGLAFALRTRLLVPIATPTPEPTPEPTATPEATDAQAAAEAALAEAFVFDLEVDEPTPEPTEPPKEWVVSDELTVVTLDVFKQIKPGLALGLNGSDCELISVETETGDTGRAKAFTIIMRRFGHGVGMSQRGAQWMAGHHGMGWREIIAFYYPGLSVERMNWPDVSLTDLDALPEGVGAARPKPTPTPTPAPLPTLVAGERYAKVTATSLNVRQQPTTAAFAIDQLSKGRRVIVSTEADENGWVRIHTAELEGFVKEEYLEYE